MTASRAPGPRTGPEPPADGTAPAPERDPYGTGTTPQGDPAMLLAELGGSWTWLLGSAVATVVPGILALAWPDESLHVLGVIVGLYLLVTGAFRFVAAFAPGHGDRHTGLLAAALYVLAGVLCLRHPLQTISALTLIIGAVWVVTGMLTAWTALAAEDLPHRGVVLGASALGIVAGVVVLGLPAESALALTRLVGLWLVLLGLAELAVAFAWRAALRKAHAGPPPGTAPAE